MAAFRALNWEYRDFLLTLPPPGVDVVRAAYPDGKYRAVLDASEIENRPPRGMMRLALRDGTPVGCGTIQTLAPGDAEIKRVYIATAARGIGAGRRMMEQLVEDCRTLGFRRILMDTGEPLKTAAALYDDMGFRRRGPYQEMPPEAKGIMIYYEMTLD
jgi:GNAT superfamily N-acetyltransferase